jgi:hypothetical protein
VALLGLASYLAVAVCAPGWHVHVAGCGADCAAGDADQTVHCHHHACGAGHEHHAPAHPHNSKDEAPVHDEKNCFVCQVLAARPLAAETVTLAVLTEPVAEAITVAVPRPDSPTPAAFRPRGPPEHA